MKRYRVIYNRSTTWDHEIIRADVYAMDTTGRLIHFYKNNQIIFSFSVYNLISIQEVE